MVLNPNSQTQTISFIPRFYVEEVDVYIYNKSTRETEIIEERPATTLNGITTVSFPFEVDESVTYVIEVKTDSQIIYKTLSFATTQNPEDYKIIIDE